MIALALRTSDRKIANNTRQITRDDGATVIRLHGTDIITDLPDGRQVYNSGGWRTVTTKARLNAFGRYPVFSKRGRWVVSDGQDRTVPFFDGITLPDAFDAPLAPDTEPSLARAINRLVRQLDTGDLPRPDFSDCWHCLMFDQEPAAADGPRYDGWVANRPRDTEPHNGREDHLRSHVEEGYLPGALIINAMRWAGYSDNAIAVHYQIGNRTSVKSAVRRYLRRRLGIG